MFDEKVCTHVLTALTHSVRPVTTADIPCVLGSDTECMTQVIYEWIGIKEYEFVLQFCTATNTDDCEGEVISESDKIPTKDEILAVLPQFTGTITQIPPAYSAIKINGERAYKLARQGETVNIPPRQVTIYELELKEQIGSVLFKFRVLCS